MVTLTKRQEAELRMRDKMRNDYTLGDKAREAWSRWFGLVQRREKDAESDMKEEKRKAK